MASLNIFLLLNSCIVLSFDIKKISHFRRRWKILMANQNYANLPFISINVPLSKTVRLKAFLWIFSQTNFIMNTITFDVPHDINVKFVHRILWVHRAFQISLQYLDPHSDQPVLLNFFWGVYIYGNGVRISWNIFDDVLKESSLQR